MLLPGGSARDCSVSVIIPCFNAEKTIDATIQSVLAQSFAEFEIVLVDDGSTDKTSEVIRAVSDGRIRLLSQANAQAGAARNAGFEAAKGASVIFLDADDLVGPDHIRSLASALDGAKDCVAASPWRRFYSDAHVEPHLDRPTYRTLPGLSWLLLDWANDYMTQPGMFLIPRQMLELHGLWIPHLSFGPNDDFEFFTRILANAREVRFAPHAMLLYRSAQAGSLSTLNDARAIECKLESFERGVEIYLTLRNTPEARRACANLFQRLIYEQYPKHRFQLTRAAEKVRALGGSDLPPFGSPKFHRLSALFGWRLASQLRDISRRGVGK